MLDYKILATGSKGNAVRIENIMIDCGISFKRMKDELYKCDTLLITHCHSDHVKEKTLFQIRKEFPRIRVYGNWETANAFAIDKVIAEKPFQLKRGNITVYPCYGKHDVEVTCYAIDFDGFLVFYATDTSEVKNPTDRKFDAIFLEANYDEKKLNEIGKQYQTRSYDPLWNAHRHLSIRACKEFYYSNRKDKECPLIQLHMSERFY